ncbi:MAG: TerB family tellurite resistance protein [Gammaproteobacteria bacterium]|nr:TerB family tellurite resistance protein [Gammaproteobacteria bacterium]
MTSFKRFFLGTLWFLLCGMMGATLGAEIGLVLGFVFAYFSMRLFKNVREETDSSQELVLILMELYGRLASIDGHVSREEISFTEEVIEDLQTQYDFSRADAIKHFNQGRESDYPINERLEKLRQHLDPENAQLCLQLFLQIAAVDNTISANEIQFLRFVGQQLQVRSDYLENFLNQVRHQGARWNESFSEDDTWEDANESAREEQQFNGQSLVKAYNTLGVAPDASNNEVRNAYRKMRSVYHPDKLQAKKIPEALIKEAERQLIDLNKAWEVIKLERNL